MGKKTIYFFSEADSKSVEFGLSNFTDLSVIIGGNYGFFPWTKEDLKFPNAEAAFQAFKCHDNQKDVEKFLTCVNPRKAKGDNTLMQKLDFLFKNSICIKHHQQFKNFKIWN